MILRRDKGSALTQDQLDANFEELDAKIEESTIDKNSLATAWVNFNGATTPPTINSSFNIDDVVRTSTGQFDVYFTENMDNENYSFSINCNTSTYNSQLDEKDTQKLKIRVRNDAGSYSSSSDISVQVFGGKD